MRSCHSTNLLRRTQSPPPPRALPSIRTSLSGIDAAPPPQTNPLIRQSPANCRSCCTTASVLLFAPPRQSRLRSFAEPRQAERQEIPWQQTLLSPMPTQRIGFASPRLVRERSDVRSYWRR